ncbi:putative Guanylate-binding protein 2 [Paratrimastix pyriformis]|uniref:Guanylate-binding protein 2 n=1 Tax=Paratrimastix pyriformis TaxID=342808 RepID=A0ABQ8ULM7_9EUKA|nr:putative Guanylate-binding protein 2 [Paratrimastix pyriformis]
MSEHHPLLEHPIQLLAWAKDETGKDKWSLCDDALTYLRSLEGPVCVLSIVGTYRTGKSFLLNQLRNCQDGFNIGPTIDPCTRGIWMWDIPPSADIQLPQMPPGSHVLMLDTEGLSSPQCSETYDVQLFSLALLLSSFFIYNSVGQIDEGAIDKLSLVVELTKHIRLYAQPSQGQKQRRGGDETTATASELGQYFPAFLWVVRDFALQLMEDGKEITSQRYLEKVLATQVRLAASIMSIIGMEDGKEITSQRYLEKVLATQLTGRCLDLSFPGPVATCFILIHHSDHLQQMATLNPDFFRPEYLEQLEQLKQIIYSRLQPKQVTGRPLNGHMFAELAHSYVAAINEGVVPTISTAWESVVAAECRRAVQVALAQFEQGLAAAFSEHPSRVIEADALHKAARESIQTGAFEGDVFKGAHMLLDTQIAANASRSTDLCGGVLVPLAKALHAMQEEKTAEVKRDKDRKEKRKQPAPEAGEKLITKMRSGIKRLVENIKVAKDASATAIFIDALSVEVEALVQRFLADARGPYRYQAMMTFLKGEALALARQIATGQLERQAKEAQDRLEHEAKRWENVACLFCKDPGSNPGRGILLLIIFFTRYIFTACLFLSFL